MKNPFANLKFDNRRILIVIAVILLILLMMNFNDKMSEMLRLTGQYERQSQRVTQMVRSQEAVETKIAYATSEDAVRRWAREEGGMIQKGDIPIVPVALTPQPTPEPAVYSNIAPAPKNWEIWYALFFGE
ncbi:MAG TPA: hypothetical protein PKW33_17540 [Anaerolineaceae bacterium]|nr:hypothetical protein [Anaerolineaceae bacterium]HPN53403.1 hypothetical protein [Anaerolineaceae bacterium]